jgi:hypothetical protein
MNYDPNMLGHVRRQQVEREHLQQVWERNDKMANWVTYVFVGVVFGAAIIGFWG